MSMLAPEPMAPNTDAPKPEMVSDSNGCAKAPPQKADHAVVDIRIAEETGSDKKACPPKADSARSLMPRVFQQRSLLAEATMIFAWTVSGVDYLAPTLWSGFSGDYVSALVLAAASCWLLGCVFLAVGLFHPPYLVKTDRAASGLWLVAGIAGTLSLALPILEDGSGHAAAWLNLAGYLSWLMATIIWCVLAWDILRATRRSEVAIVIFWLLCGLFFLMGACVDELTGASRWSYLSSAIWWLLGVVAWISVILSGGSFLGVS